MNMKLVDTELLRKVTLEADEEGIRFQESHGFGMSDTYRHTFGEIDAILREESNPGAPRLSIQVGAKVYSIRYKSYEARQCAVVDYIVQKAAQSREAL